MKTKLIGILVCMLLTATIIPITGQVTKSIISKDTNGINPSSNGDKWMKTFGGSDSDWAWSAQQTSDGGYVAVGDTKSFGAGGRDIWLIKVDSNGNKEWDKTFGSTNDEDGFSVQQTSDGGYIIAGAYGGHVWLIKTNDQGDLQWESKYNSGTGYSVRQTADEGFIVVGDYSGNVLLLKVNKYGFHIWSKTYEDGWDKSWSVRQTDDGGYIIVGYTHEDGVYSAWLMKTDDMGEKEWTKTLGSEMYGRDVLGASDGGYVVIGETYGYRSKGWMIKTDAYGDERWRKYYGRGEYGLTWYAPWSFSQTSDGGYIITGYFLCDWKEERDLWLAKTGSNGNLKWSKTFGKGKPSEGSIADVGIAVQQTNDGGYIVGGATQSYGAGGYDVWLIKTDANGNVARNRATQRPFLNFLQQHPNLFPILRLLMQRLGLQ